MDCELTIALTVNRCVKCQPQCQAGTGEEVKEKLTNAPLYFALSEVRFNTVLGLEGSYLPGIQEQLRKAGYPDFQPSTELTFQLKPSADSDGKPRVDSIGVNRYVFRDIGRTAGFSVSANSIAFFTSVYDVFNEFRQRMAQGLEIVHGAIGLSFFERIGIRYLNAVLPRSGETLEDYLIPEVLGLTFKLSGTIEHTYSETKRRLESGGGVVARARVRSGRVALPPELGNVGMMLNERFTGFEGMHAVLDTDAFIEKREGFELDAIKAQVTRLHDENERVFRTIATKRALSVWE
jgi:uncharacterized protein (TIGR04255 family)